MISTSWKSRASPFAGKPSFEVADIFEAVGYPKGHRYKDPPPADVKPDPDYEPDVGEWFWLISQTRSSWYRFCRQENNGLTNVRNEATSIGWLPSDKGKCLPATAPE